MASIGATAGGPLRPDQPVWHARQDPSQLLAGRVCVGPRGAPVTRDRQPHSCFYFSWRAPGGSTPYALTNIHPITNERTSVPAPATKSVVFENMAIFGYTGLSILERDVMHAIELGQVGLERAFRRSMVPDPVPYQAVLVSGFRITNEGPFEPFNAKIANSRDERSPTRKFAVEVFDVPPGQMTLTQAPRWIRPRCDVRRRDGRPRMGDS